MPPKPPSPPTEKIKDDAEAFLSAYPWPASVSNRTREAVSEAVRGFAAKLARRDERAVTAIMLFPVTCDGCGKVVETPYPASLIASPCASCGGTVFEVGGAVSRVPDEEADDQHALPLDPPATPPAPPPSPPLVPSDEPPSPDAAPPEGSGDMTGDLPAEPVPEPEAVTAVVASPDPVGPPDAKGPPPARVVRTDR